VVAWLCVQPAWTWSAVELLGRDSASATTCRRLVVYSEMKAICRCWQPNTGGDNLRRAANSGLWLVHNWNCLPSSLEWKY
jgi:hypothetical protein